MSLAQNGCVAEEEQSSQHDEMWRQMLMGELKSVQRLRRAVGWIPSEPRCKLCAAPFGSPGKMLVRFLGFAPSRINRRLCRACIRHMEKEPGGAEVELTLLFADVRGSTALAEQAAAQEFSRLIARFYGVAAAEIDKQDGIVDKFVGDEVVALFIPGFAGADHAARAIEAAHALLRRTGNDGDDPWIRVGAAVHTGVAYVGTVGEGDAVDFTALGDAANTAARLASSAGPGEILVSSAAAAAAELDTSELEGRTLTLRGRSECVQAWVATAQPAKAVA
jgi:adenylate cyclase